MRIFESCLRTERDLAGVFEHDGEAGYFYLYEAGGMGNGRVRESVRIVTAGPDLCDRDVAVRWDEAEEKVGLFIREKLVAVFDVRRPSRRAEDGAEEDGAEEEGAGPTPDARTGLGAVF